MAGLTTNILLLFPPLLCTSSDLKAVGWRPSVQGALVLCQGWLCFFLSGLDSLYKEESNSCLVRSPPCLAVTLPSIALDS